MPKIKEADKKCPSSAWTKLTIDPINKTSKLGNAM
jgi:hypothetical protein